MIFHHHFLTIELSSHLVVECDKKIGSTVYKTLSSKLIGDFQTYFNSLDFPLSGYSYQTLQGYFFNDLKLSNYLK